MNDERLKIGLQVAGYGMKVTSYELQVIACGLKKPASHSERSRMNDERIKIRLQVIVTSFRFRVKKY